MDSRVALDSVMAGKYGLMRSSIVTVANELNAEEMVLRGKKLNVYMLLPRQPNLNQLPNLKMVLTRSQTSNMHYTNEDA